LDANWAPKLIPTTPKAIRAIFVEIYHCGVFRLNISDPFFFLEILPYVLKHSASFSKTLAKNLTPPSPWEFPLKVVIPSYIQPRHKEPPVQEFRRTSPLPLDHIQDTNLLPDREGGGNPSSQSWACCHGFTKPFLLIPFWTFDRIHE